MRKIGFTGTRNGMTDVQKERVRDRLKRNQASELHHGDCIGADEEAHGIALALGVDVVVHPPTDNRARAHCDVGTVLAPLPYLKRNHAIVDACDLMLAAPDGPERQRSGTWATIRYARKQGKVVILLLPGTKQ